MPRHVVKKFNFPVDEVNFSSRLIGFPDARLMSPLFQDKLS